MPGTALVNYYLAQAGGGGGTQFYAGSSYQKGYGIGSFLGGLFRSVLPLLRSGAAAVGREAARAGAHVLADVAAGDPIGDSVQNHAGQALTNLKRKAAAKMQGSGRSIKRRKKTTTHHSAHKHRGKKKFVLSDALS